MWLERRNFLERMLYVGMSPPAHDTEIELHKALLQYISSPTQIAILVPFQARSTPTTFILLNLIRAVLTILKSNLAL